MWLERVGWGKVRPWEENRWDISSISVSGEKRKLKNKGMEAVLSLFLSSHSERTIDDHSSEHSKQGCCGWNCDLWLLNELIT